MSEWIDINTRTPEDGQKVLTYFEFTGVEIAKYKDVSEEVEVVEGKEYKGLFGKNMFYNRAGFLTDDVTHWMELPDPPQ